MSSKVPNTDSETAALVNHQGERSLNRFALFFLPCAIGLAADLITKSMVFARCFEPAISDRTSIIEFAQQEKHWWIEGVFGIQTSTNPGALFGMGEGLSWLFASFSIVAIIGILVWLFCFQGSRDRWLTFTLGMVTGGILGNLYDRVGLGSAANYPESIHDNVRDWILFRIDGVPFFDPWPNFNIADSLLVGGAIMLFIHALFFAEPEDAASVDKTSESRDASPGDPAAETN